MLRTLPRRSIVVAYALAVFFAAAPAAAKNVTRTQTASSGSVTATFSFTVTSQNTYPTKTLTISRAGQVLYSQPVTSSYCALGGQPQKYCAPGAPGTGQSSVHVLDLEHNGEPDVVLDLYSGGAHCCSIEQVFSFKPATGTYAVSQHNFRDPGSRIVDLGKNGHYEFLTADDSFAYAFTDFAASGLPIQILTFANRRFTNVTRQYPKLIRKDAAMWLKDFKRDLVDGVGLIAAWAADEESLGRKALVSSTLAKELKAGNLRAIAGVGGKKFIKELNKLLRKDGYVR